MSEYTRETPAGLMLFGRAWAIAGKRDELLRLLAEAVDLAAEHEPEGPVSATFSVSTTDPNLVLLQEHWPSRAALGHHQALKATLPAYVALNPRLDALLAKPIEIVEVMQPWVRFSREVTLKENSNV